jgi:hypothetical protein
MRRSHSCATPPLAVSSSALQPGAKATLAAGARTRNDATGCAAAADDEEEEEEAAARTSHSRTSPATSHAASSAARSSSAQALMKEAWPVSVHSGRGAVGAVDVASGGTAVPAAAAGAPGSVAASHSLTVPSSLADASRRASAEAVRLQGRACASC